MNNLTLGSLFDGSGGFPLGGIMCGIRPIWASEIEPFPIRVTTKRLPFMKHYGDINKISGADIEPVDIITFGSPCTDMSIAGKRAGLDGKQSTLFYQAIRIIKEMRCKTDGKYPRWIVWENVPGAFSSNKGEDFRCVLESISKIKNENFSIPKPPKWSNAGEIVGDNFSLAWRVLDAQYWRVPQRRRRVFLVADFGSKCAGKILFESESVSRYSAKSFRTWQKTAGSFTNGTTDTSNICLKAIAIENHPSDSRLTISDKNKAQTLTSRMGTGGNNVPLVMSKVPKIYGICSKDSNSMKSDNPHSGFYEANTSRTLDKNGGNPSCNQGGVAVVESIPFTQNPYFSEEIQPTLVARGPGAIQNGYIVRRLTPTECARLQGFPDSWCADLETENPTDEEITKWQKIFDDYNKTVGKTTKPKTEKQIRKWLKNPHSDSAEYKMWGNGVALPCVYFVLSNIVR